jgi:hypothetical protein
LAGGALNSRARPPALRSGDPSNALEAQAARIRRFESRGIMPTRYENYPFWMIAVAGGLSLAVYAVGAYVMAQLGIWFAAAYLGYCVFVELQLYRGSCVNCYYYGKFCGFGKGKICSFLFSRGDPVKFARRNPTWKDLLPDMLVLIFPLLGGVVKLIAGFEWVVLAAILLLLFLASLGNAFVRGSLACKHCKQCEAGCPAAKFFEQAK